jgi:hypothetical protein
VQRSRICERCANDKATLACPRHRLERIDRKVRKNLRRVSDAKCGLPCAAATTAAA